MTMTRRERLIALLTALLVGGFLADQLVLTPLLARRDAMVQRRDALTRELDESRRLIDGMPRLQRQWDERRAAGLTVDHTDAEAKLLHNLRSWGQRAGLTVQSITPERSTSRAKVREAAVQMTVVCDLKALTRFIESTELSASPLRIREVQITSRREGFDDLLVKFRLSTAYLPDEDNGKTSADDRKQTVQR